MSLASRQVKKETNRIIEEHMKDGYIPSVEYISAKLGEFYSKYTPGAPMLQARHQPYRKLFDVDIYNSNLNELYEDLNNLYEEIVDQFTVVLKDFDYYDTARKQLLFKVKELRGELSGLLLAAANTDGYVYSVYENFIDRSKIDLEHTTCEVDTEAGIITLKESMSGIVKVDMSHYHETINYPILSESKYSKNIVSNTIFPMSKFGYVFSDVGGTWMQNVVSSKPGDMVVSFIIDICPDNADGLYISRIEMEGQSPKIMYVQPLYSIDNVNFVALPVGFGSGVKEVITGLKTVWNFDQTRVKYIKFMVSKTVEDEQISNGNYPAYRYVFGFKTIKIFRMGYNATSVLYSKAHVVEDPADEAMTIDKAALEVEQDLQSGTSAEYYLSLGSDTTDDPTEYNWAAVSPVNDPSPKEQQIVDFKHVAFFNNVPKITWDESAFNDPVETYREIPFHRIYDFPYEPVKNSVVLYRGRDDWQVTPRYEIERKAVYDEKIPFGNLTSVTLNKPESTPIEGDGLIRGSVRAKVEPGQSPAYWYTTPGDFTINYATKVLAISEGGAISRDPASPNNTIYVDYQYDNEESEPTVYTTNVYVSNPDGIDINHIPFSTAEVDAGQYTTVSTSDGVLDVSQLTKFYMAQGWHQVVTTAEPCSGSDRFFTVNGRKYLHELVEIQYAFVQTLQEVSWFVLKYNTLMTDHTKFAIHDYNGDGKKEIVVNYRPQTTKWGSVKNDLLCALGPESYVISYKFITELTNRIYLKVVLSRDNAVASPSATPSIKSYTIKLGY